MYILSNRRVSQATILSILLLTVAITVSLIGMPLASACHPPPECWGIVEAETIQVSASHFKMVATASLNPAHSSYPNVEITSVTFKWYGPFTGETTTPPAGWGFNKTHTDSDGPFTSDYDPLTEADLGWWLVEAYFTGNYHHPDGWTYEGCTDKKITTVPVTEVPWFTSLPLALLASIGAVVFLKRKGSLPF